MNNSITHPNASKTYTHPNMVTNSDKSAEKSSNTTDNNTTVENREKKLKKQEMDNLQKRIPRTPE